MGHLSYIFKLLIVTVIVIIVMQAHVNKKTLENHAEEFIRKSSITEPARDIAKAGFFAFKHYYHSAVNAADSFVEKEFRSENSPGRRRLAAMERSLGYHKERNARARKNGEEPEEASEEAENEAGEE